MRGSFECKTFGARHWVHLRAMGIRPVSRDRECGGTEGRRASPFEAKVVGEMPGVVLAQGQRRMTELLLEAEHAVPARG
jgi:hypothetical protein